MAKRVRKESLTLQQVKALLYPTLTGPDHAFENDQERKEAWLGFRDEMMDHPRNPCTRPFAWWDYDFPGVRLFGESQRQALARLNLLTIEEIAFLKDAGQWPVEPCPGPDWDPRDSLRE
jgi:hypothetical protein